MNAKADKRMKPMVGGGRIGRMNGGQVGKRGQNGPISCKPLIYYEDALKSVQKNQRQTAVSAVTDRRYSGITKETPKKPSLLSSIKDSALSFAQSTRVMSLTATKRRFGRSAGWLVWKLAGEPREPWQLPHPADCQSAIQQAASLRYNRSGEYHRRGRILNGTAMVQRWPPKAATMQFGDVALSSDECKMSRSPSPLPSSLRARVNASPTHGILSHAFTLLLATLCFCTHARAAEVSFRNDVMPVISKAGCNAGTCHGNKNGKGGFKLSLRGQDPDVDFLTLTRDLFSRRIDPMEPEQSLILLKPTTQVAHEGGLRFKPGSPEFEILRHWVAQGMPNDLASAPKLERIDVTPLEQVLVEPVTNVQFQVRGKFSDGTSRDLTSLAVYEPANGLAKVTHDGLAQRQGFGETTVIVRFLQAQEAVRLAFVPARPGFKWGNPPANNYIDDQVFAKLHTLRMNPSGLCADDVFVRRAYLDLLGLLPTMPEAQAFVADKHRDKRARLIDQLLERPEFADFWTLKWADLLNVEAHSLDPKGVQNFHHWIHQSIADNKPLDQFVRELITARGSTYSSPAANYYRPHRDPVARAKAAAQVFLGTRLQCAECHNHPFDRWTQDDYYDWAGVFAGVKYKVLENKREISSDQHEWKGEQVVYVAAGGAVKNPRTGKDANPRFLGVMPSVTVGRAVPSAPPANLNAQSVARDANGAPADEFESLAGWLTSPDNTLFARVQANRIWYQLLGRGLVDPPDDFRATNPASHPALLDALAKDFVKHKFDVRFLIRLIMNSRAYQAACDANDTNQGDEVNYSHTLIRRLGAEQMLDCQSEVAGVPLRFTGYPVGMRAAQLPGVRPEGKGKRRANQLDQFLELFGKPPRLMTTDTERSCECNMGQAFQMISGPTVNELLAEKENRVSRLIAAGKSNREIVEELFWSALTRPPTAKELQDLSPALEAAKDRRAELEDVLWGLLNSKDFVFRR